MGNDLHHNKPKFLNKDDLIILLATKINLANIGDYDQFVYSILFDTEELKTYVPAIQGLNLIQ